MEAASVPTPRRAPGSAGAPAPRRSRSAGAIAFSATKVGVLVMAVAWIVPLALLAVTPMKSFEEYSSTSQWALPSDPLQLFDNMKQAWDSAGLGSAFFASLSYGLVGALVAILCGALGAYAITRLPLKGRFFWFLLVFSGTLFPFQMYLIPLFQLYTDTNLYDTWIGMAMFYSAIAVPFCLFVMRGFFSTIPPEIEDAAKLDGASSWGILWRVLMPLARGPIAVLILFQFTWIWNDFMFGLVLSTSDGVRPIMPALVGLQGASSTAGPPVVLAGALIGSLPTIALFLLLGRYLLSGLTLTATGKDE
ncbi:carbohydrate ABC transporter permease [Conexibacter arvalis]|uniref:Multiple sugar transport system permease protein n=1 Tax=Conexibacter arvalis TaxID=912552 RepID=A0A840IFW9_9ACTN|nr:carbohydrate ABC transporter permease [Conexibacter arvalis]MBB4662840.1 multiple sugar transport system permease protein [Conexibacter arvalis]